MSLVFVGNDTTKEITRDILDELSRAVEKHPIWPIDAIHAAAILSEEAGELVQAANDFHDIYPGHLIEYREKREHMKTEATQVGAMAIRFLMHLKEYQPK